MARRILDAAVLLAVAATLAAVGYAAIAAREATDRAAEAEVEAWRKQ